VSRLPALCLLFVLLLGGSLSAQGPDFTFGAPSITSQYPQLTGALDFTATLTITEAPGGTGFPNDTQGFSMGLAHDPAVLSATALAVTGPVSALDGGSGPAFVSLDLWSNGVTIGTVFDFFSVELLAFPTETPVVEVSYSTVAANLSGSTNTTITSLTWSDSIGTPPVENVMVIGGGNAQPLYSNGIVTLEPVSAIYTFSTPDVTQGYPQGSGQTGFTAGLSILEDAGNPGFPNATQGFSMGVAHDPTYLVANTLDLGAALLALDGGGGPAFASLDILPGGVTVGVVYDFFGVNLLSFPTITEVAVVDYSGVTANLAGATSPIVTSLTFSDNIGTPPVENVMVVDSANLQPTYENAVITLEPQPLLFTFVLPSETIPYPELTGVTNFSISAAIEENAQNSPFPNATQGFSMGIAHDPLYLQGISITPAAVLAALDGGGGPAFFDADVYSGGVTSGVVYDFFGVETISFTALTDVLDIEYETIPANLIGATVPTTTALSWSNAIGSPPVQNVIVIASASFSPTFANGALTLEPVIGGFRRMDCNIDGSSDIGDAIAALSILFTGGTMLCQDACDVNDDGEFNIADAIAALSILFSGAAPPPPPIGDCGPDPTPDALECDTYNSC